MAAPGLRPGLERDGEATPARRLAYRLTRPGRLVRMALAIGSLFVIGVSWGLILAPVTLGARPVAGPTPLGAAAHGPNPALSLVIPPPRPAASATASMLAALSPPSGEGAARPRKPAGPKEEHWTLSALPGAGMAASSGWPDGAGLPPWRRYAVAPPSARGRAMVAVVLDDLGLDRPHTARAVALPGPLTLSFMSYAPDVRGQAAAARARGHELLVHVPMEPVDHHQHPGPKALYVDLNPVELVGRLNWALNQFDGFVGLNNHMGSRFTASPQAMAAIMPEIARRGLLYLDSRTAMRSVAGAVAAAHGVPQVGRDVFLDDVDTRSAVRGQLAQLEAVARRQGHAIAIGHPRAATLAELEPWLARLERNGLVLVPLTAIVRARRGPTTEMTAMAGN